MNIIDKTILWATVSLVGITSSTGAALLIDGSFTTGTTDASLSNNETAFSELNAGWDHKGSYDISDDHALNTTTRSPGGLAQVNSVTSENGNSLQLSFDWMPPSGATGEALDLTYQIIGWKKTGTPVDGSFFVGINYSSPKIGTLNNTAEHIDLLDGSRSSSEINASIGTFSGTAGTVKTFSRTIDLTGFDADCSNIDDYDYIGLRLATTEGSGGIIDNVSLSTSNTVNPQPFISIDTGYTIQKVRTAVDGVDTMIIGSTYEGALLGYTWDGSAVWTNELSGYMNHDIWCDDLNGDNSDEILIANADGLLYCIDSATGTTLWEFAPNNGGHLPPMYAVCTVRTNDMTYIVCGPFDKNIYYLDSTGTLVKTIHSSTYSIANTWGDNAPPDRLHNANFLRPIPQPDGSDKLAVLGAMSHMQDNGVFYLFDPLADLPYLTRDVNGPKVSGDLRVIDPDNDGNYELLIGSSALNGDSIVLFDPVANEMNEWTLTGNKGSSGYRVTQTETYPDGDGYKFFILCGATYLDAVPSGDSNIVSSASNIHSSYAFNDMWKDQASGNIILASAQSGGSCIHIINPQDPSWKAAFQSLQPPGKIASILNNTATARTQLQSFSKPAWERDPVEVILTAADPEHPVAIDIQASYDSPRFLNYYWDSYAQDPVDWDRDTELADNPEYRDKRDGRRSYTKTQSQILAFVAADDDGGTGRAMWGGHGNDPYYYGLDTLKGLIDLSGGENTVLIWPEMNGSSEAFEKVMHHRFYPLAEYARTNNANILVRNKNVFWQGAVYLPAWERMRNGDFADVFTSALEETTDKTMELSVVGRQGMWASGALDSWGMRCSRDNPSFDRARQHSYMRLPNHFLRNMVYNLAGGATVLNVTYVDADYMSFAWELVAQGALFIPKREEVVSFSPVHLSMHDPDEHYLEDGENNKWITFYDQPFEQNNPFVFSRMNGSWPAAPNTEWDFSRYAAGVKDRRQNFIPPYSNGTVLVTPVQEGALSSPGAIRGKMTDHLHPMYSSIMKEFITDGRDYISSDGTTRLGADTHYTNVKTAIENTANYLPLKVTGDVAWVCAQTSPTHLRLTLVDSGYLNPKARTAKIQFGSVRPVAMTDVLDGASFDVSNPQQVEIEVPLGLFRFIDIELTEPFTGEFSEWTENAVRYGLSGDPEADFDNDGQSDLHEFALNGDPTNETVLAVNPSIVYHPDNNVSFYNPELTADNPGITYINEWSTNLVTGPWNNNWNLSTNYPGTSPDYSEAHHRTWGGDKKELFFRLQVTQP